MTLGLDSGVDKYPDSIDAVLHVQMFLFQHFLSFLFYLIKLINLYRWLPFVRGFANKSNVSACGVYKDTIPL